MKVIIDILSVQKKSRDNEKTSSKFSNFEYKYKEDAYQIMRK
jgi:hypothetical protein